MHGILSFCLTPGGTADSRLRLTSMESARVKEGSMLRARFDPEESPGRLISRASTGRMPQISSAHWLLLAPKAHGLFSKVSPAVGIVEPAEFISCLPARSILMCFLCCGRLRLRYNWSPHPALPHSFLKGCLSRSSCCLPAHCADSSQ